MYYFWLGKDANNHHLLKEAVFIKSPRVIAEEAGELVKEYRKALEEAWREEDRRLDQKREEIWR